MRRYIVGTVLLMLDFSLLLRLRMLFKIARKCFISQKAKLFRQPYQNPGLLICIACRAKPQANFTALYNIRYRTMILPVFCMGVKLGRLY
jgi:hypothetical protein